MRVCVGGGGGGCRWGNFDVRSLTGPRREYGGTVVNKGHKWEVWLPFSL